MSKEHVVTKMGLLEFRDGFERDYRAFLEQGAYLNEPDELSKDEQEISRGLKLKYLEHLGIDPDKLLNASEELSELFVCWLDSDCVFCYEGYETEEFKKEVEQLGTSAEAWLDK